MRDIIKLGVILLVICGVASGLLGATNAVTEPKILESRAKAEAAARTKVMPEADDITQAVEQDIVQQIASGNNIPADALTAIYIAKKDGEIIGYVFKCKASGFGGAIEVITGIKLDRTISGVAVTNHAETVGLGAKAAEDEWPAQYIGKKGGLSVTKNAAAGDNEISAITGATITSRAVTLAVNYATAAFDAYIKIITQEGAFHEIPCYNI